LSDDQFARIEHWLPGRHGHVGRNSDKGNRLFVEAVIWKFRTRAAWRDLPNVLAIERTLIMPRATWAMRGMSTRSSSSGWQRTLAHHASTVPPPL
jgi:transposase